MQGCFGAALRLIHKKFRCRWYACIDACLAPTAPHPRWRWMTGDLDL